MLFLHPSMGRIFRLFLISVLLVSSLSGCSKDEPLPSPYTSPEQEESEGEGEGEEEGEGEGQGEGEGEGGDENPAARVYSLPIIETTDIHGYIVNNQNTYPLHKEDINQKNIFDSQLSKFVNANETVSILNSFPIFIYEYLK